LTAVSTQTLPGVRSLKKKQTKGEIKAFMKRSPNIFFEENEAERDEASRRMLARV
jgi:hypothetical protein